MRDQIRQRFLIDLGQCKRAKQRALYNHKGGVIKHYGRLYDYRQALLESNPGLTCRLEVEEVSSESTYFKRFYICFKGLKDGWLDGCRRIIGLDGCFLKHTCRGELLTAMGRDANNQMYPNFKKKYNGLQLQRLFWGAASSTVEELFYAKMDDLKYINLEAYEYLVARNPNSWCRAFFNLIVKCAAFENGISERYHKAILLQRSKPIITINCCWLWQLSGVPCIHAVVGYMHLNRDPDEGVHFSYSQEAAGENNSQKCPDLARKQMMSKLSMCWSPKAKLDENPSAPKPITDVNSARSMGDLESRGYGYLIVLVQRRRGGGPVGNFMGGVSVCLVRRGGAKSKRRLVVVAEKKRFQVFTPSSILYLPSDYAAQEERKKQKKKEDNAMMLPFKLYHKNQRKVRVERISKHA
ncbi:hypothetical protein Tco_0926076 [Tanacetum coccineum]|uniref:SWIM-type domain-containing protein n=1 Tax=Tanacetum coccineum TaxID=301880 RepID=A0ABQ5DBA3_9ASTR